jgi:hypothetical protein
VISVLLLAIGNGPLTESMVSSRHANATVTPVEVVQAQKKYGTDGRTLGERFALAAHFSSPFGRTRIAERTGLATSSAAVCAKAGAHP